MALGTDQGGSIRNPCGRCGIVGLKPTFGLSLDHVGPMAKNVHDLSLLLEVCLLTYHKKNHLLTAISLFFLDEFFLKMSLYGLLLHDAGYMISCLIPFLSVRLIVSSRLR